MIPVITVGGETLPRPEVNRLFTIEARTRGQFHEWPFHGIPEMEAEKSSFTLGALMESLRSQVGHMPLTILIHGWGSEAARHFFDLLETLLLKDDAIWLLPLREREGEAGIEDRLPSGGEAHSDSALIDKAITLNLEQATDQRLYDNLVSDIVFFPAAEEEEHTRITQFAERAQLVLVESTGPYKEAVLSAGTGMVVGEWHSSKLPSPGTEAAPPLQDSEGTASDDDKVMDAIGTQLTELVEYYENLFERRPYLRTDIKTMEEQHPELSTLAEGLIWQAHKHNWPEWAVECLPSLYVRSERDTGAASTALVWHFIVACLPESHAPKILAELCDGRFLMVALRGTEETFLKTIAHIFEEHLSNFPYASERSYRTGAINNALQVIELWLRHSKPEAAEHVKQLRKVLLAEGKVVRP